MMLNLRAVVLTLGIWTAFTFVFCVTYGLAVPESDRESWHCAKGRV